MTPARFVEVFKAAITVEGAGNPALWRASSPILRGQGPMGEPNKASGETCSEAILNLAHLVVLQAREEVEDARSTLRRREEAMRRIEAAQAELGGFQR